MLRSMFHCTTSVISAVLTALSNDSLLLHDLSQPFIFLPRLTLHHQHQPLKTPALRPLVEREISLILYLTTVTYMVFSSLHLPAVLSITSL
jgi:hypothetical protein